MTFGVLLILLGLLTLVSFTRLDLFTVMIAINTLALLSLDLFSLKYNLSNTLDPETRAKLMEKLLKYREEAFPKKLCGGERVD